MPSSSPKISRLCCPRSGAGRRMCSRPKSVWVETGILGRSRHPGGPQSRNSRGPAGEDSRRGTPESCAMPNTRRRSPGRFKKGPPVPLAQPSQQELLQFLAVLNTPGAAGESVILQFFQPYPGLPLPTRAGNPGPRAPRSRRGRASVPQNRNPAPAAGPWLRPCN